MLARRIYYILKPYLPWRMRISLRRFVARRILSKSRSVWPVNTGAATPPAGWTGWPEGKKFAVVLTHDVEGPKGVSLCRELADLEKSLGFRSSFNFIPEGTYKVSPELRHWLAENGFEIGVHDLNHDGHLYSSHSGFLEKADRINRYIDQWGASGFRGGFMLRNLDWIHHLDIKYDASTFDTDPFEPQPDGTGTIFPFWISTPGGHAHRNGSTVAPARAGGYCELPYTLPQDSTLFLVLQESTSDIWRQKADWIASHGGMILVNVHPDYLPIKGCPRKTAKAVKDHYADLLKHLSSNYGDTFWHPLPREMAAFVHSARDRVSAR